MGIFAFVMALLIEALALFIAQQIILPLRQLAESAGLIAAGDLERTITVEGQPVVLDDVRAELRHRPRTRATS